MSHGLEVCSRSGYILGMARAAAHHWLTFETPAQGGHLGFWQGPGRWWLEERFLDYLAAPL